LEFLMGLFGIYFIFILFFWRFNQMGWGWNTTHLKNTQGICTYINLMDRVIIKIITDTSINMNNKVAYYLPLFHACPSYLYIPSPALHYNLFGKWCSKFDVSLTLHHSIYLFQLPT
jgi:hypothetical protein